MDVHQRGMQAEVGLHPFIHSYFVFDVDIGVVGIDVGCAKQGVDGVFLAEIKLELGGTRAEPVVCPFGAIADVMVGCRSVVKVDLRGVIFKLWHTPGYVDLYGKVYFYSIHLYHPSSESGFLSVLTT